MEGQSERQYATHVGLSRGAIQKAKEVGRLVQHADGSIDAAASDARRGAMTDPAKQRTAVTKPPPPARKLKPVPDTALSTVGDTLRENGLVPPVTGAGTIYLQARTAKEVLKAQDRHLAIQKKKGALVDRARAETLVFRRTRQERDTWVGDGRSFGPRTGAGAESGGGGRTAARTGGGDGAQAERANRRIRLSCDQVMIFSIRVTPGNPAKCTSQVSKVAPRCRAVAKMMASAVASLCARQSSAAPRAISVSSGMI